MSSSHPLPAGVDMWELPAIVDDLIVDDAGPPLRHLARAGLQQLYIDARSVMDINVRGLALLVAVHRIAASSGTRLIVLPSRHVHERIVRLGLAEHFTLQEAAPC